MNALERIQQIIVSDHLKDFEAFQTFITKLHHYLTPQVRQPFPLKF